ncbi:hypothetical protein CAI21_03430 [Alkalilimnicola ehrlichii]|uniref:hypothetical protein n=1 Tax=Alkalilimnicola ehrlichii TaxID=351052 RepID=UPI000E2F5013|nr:hypothetical protein [Alkalilimnicola ehrlichii]RFA31035.1 hypothetical protein CAI21_03430 [Alkalilimnicola ehrlichii]
MLLKLLSSNKKTMLLGVLLSALAGCATPPDRRDDWFSQDKFLHFAVASGISAAATKYQVDNDADDSLARQRAVLFTMTLGTGKELYDQEVRGRFLVGGI